MINETFHGLDI